MKFLNQQWTGRYHSHNYYSNIDRIRIMVDFMQSFTNIICHSLINDDMKWDKIHFHTA